MTADIGLLDLALTTNCFSRILTGVLRAFLAKLEADCARLDYITIACLCAMTLMLRTTWYL